MQAGLDFQVALSQYLDARAGRSAARGAGDRPDGNPDGVSRVDALRHLRDAFGTQFAGDRAAIIQGIELGSSLTPILKAQAQALRRRRSYMAEKRAAVAPLKLMFPLFVFIFPDPLRRAVRARSCSWPCMSQAMNRRRVDPGSGPLRPGRGGPGSYEWMVAS